MTSKTFKSALDSPVTLEVERETHPAGVYLTIGQATILLASSDAPALALAVLEAAGYSEEYEGGNCWVGPLGQAMHMLRLETEAQKRITAEARERAELEAEALELCNAAIRQGGCAIYDSFSQIPTPDMWLAVARRARELAKEATK